MNNIDCYLEGLYIHEEIDLPKLDVKVFTAKLKKAVDVNDPKGTVQNLMKIAPPGIKPSMVKKIDSYISGKYDKYNKLQSTATKVIKNSIDGVSPKMAEIAGSYIVISSMFAKKSQSNLTHEANMKLVLKEFVVKTRKFGEDYEEEEKKDKKIRPSDYADLSVAWVVITMSTALAIGIGMGVYVALKIVAIAFAATIAGFMVTLQWVIILVVFTFICAFIASKTGVGG